MSPRQVRSALRAHFGGAGFVEEGPRFISQTEQLTHCVEVAAVRRLAGSIQIHHHVSLKGRGNPTLTEELASHGHHSPYPRIWSAGSVDAGLVLDQVSAICRSFQTRLDLAHFFSDRVRPGAEEGPIEADPFGTPNSLSAAESSQSLKRIARELLDEDFSLVPRQGDFELWASNQEVQGYRHCVYLETNYSCTLAVLVNFALPAMIIAGGITHERERRMLMVAPKQVLFRGSRPLLIPTSAVSFDGDGQIRSALIEHQAQNPPHLLPR
jgi:hypothetical protein